MAKRIEFVLDASATTENSDFVDEIKRYVLLMTLKSSNGCARDLGVTACFEVDSTCLNQKKIVSGYTNGNSESNTNYCFSSSMCPLNRSEV